MDAECEAECGISICLRVLPLFNEAFTIYAQVSL